MEKVCNEEQKKFSSKLKQLKKQKLSRHQFPKESITYVTGIRKYVRE